MKRIISLILCVAMLIGSVATLSGCFGKKYDTDALVIMTDNLDGLFNPFYSTSAADGTIVSMTQIGMLTTGIDENGDVNVAYGDDEAVVVKDYKQVYDSASDTTTYTFVIKNGLKFSDGVALTIEDVLFNMYVYLDPVYTGSSTMYSTDILGLSEYRTQQSSSVSGGDDLISSTARDRAQDRINELINLFKETAETASGNYDTTVAKMEAAIKSHILSDGYLNAVATPDKQSTITYRNLLDDYHKALEYFREELETDYDSAKDAYTEEPYKSNGFDEITSFMYMEGFVTVEYGEKDGKPNADKSTIINVSRGYNTNTITTKEAAIEHVYNSKINSELHIILQAWATAQKLETEFMAKATEVLLRENMTDGELLYPNIEGIVSLGHTSDVTSVTIGSNTYTVAHDHNDDGTPVNADEYDVLEITIEGVDPKAIWNFAFAVAPQHYYAEGNEVDIVNNKFGVKYASFDFMIDEIQSQRNVTVPMGAGAYVATNASNGDNPTGSEFYQNNIVYFKSNPNFLLGEAKIEKVRYKVVSSTNALQALETGEVHFVTPQLTPENEKTLNDLESEGFESLQSRQLGYGYIGVNAGKIPNIYLRKAIMAAMDTSLAISYYSMGTAERIYWPMSTVSWAYPKDETGNNKTNTIGYPAINFDMDEAKAQIEEYMRLAASHAGGYDESDLELIFTIAGANLTEHPTYQVFQSAAQLLNSCGWDIEVIADTQALTKLSTGSLAVWAAAWGTTVDPDMYQVYHKNSTATSVYSWGYREILANDSLYWYEQDVLDELSILIDEARETDDRATRTALYEEAMELVLDLAVELPVYQRNELYAYNANVIDSNSLPSDINPYTSPLDKIWEIEFAK